MIFVIFAGVENNFTLLISMVYTIKLCLLNFCSLLSNQPDENSHRDRYDLIWFFLFCGVCELQSFEPTVSFSATYLLSFVRWFFLIRILFHSATLSELETDIWSIRFYFVVTPIAFHLRSRNINHSQTTATRNSQSGFVQYWNEYRENRATSIQLLCFFSPTRIFANRSLLQPC